MKHKYPKIGMLLILVVAVLSCLTIYGVFVAASPAAQNSGIITTKTNQQPIIDELMANLQKSGIPIKSIQIDDDARWNPTRVITCILQSTSQNDKVAPSDPLYLNFVGHQINLANQRELQIGAIHTILMNINGKIIDDVFHATNKKDEIASGFSQPSPVSLSSVSSFLKDVPLSGIILNNINVNLTNDGQYYTVFSLQNQDIVNANIDCTNAVSNIRTEVTKINCNKGSQIAVYEIHIVDETGNPLFNYISDLQFMRTTCWHSDSIGKLDLMQ